jgi:hypothetical protein
MHLSIFVGAAELAERFVFSMAARKIKISSNYSQHGSWERLVLKFFHNCCGLKNNAATAGLLN